MSKKWQKMIKNRVLKIGIYMKLYLKMEKKVKKKASYFFLKNDVFKFLFFFNPEQFSYNLVKNCSKSKENFVF